MLRLKNCLERTSLSQGTHTGLDQNVGAVIIYCKIGFSVVMSGGTNALFNKHSVLNRNDYSGFRLNGLVIIIIIFFKLVHSMYGNVRAGKTLRIERKANEYEWVGMVLDGKHGQLAEIVAESSCGGIARVGRSAVAAGRGWHFLLHLWNGLITDRVSDRVLSKMSVAAASKRERKRARDGRTERR